RCKQLLLDFDEAEASISAQRELVRGHLVVSAPASFGRQHVAPHVMGFKKKYPELKLSFNFTDSVVDLVREGYDMAIRIGGVIDPNYVAIHLFLNQRAVCGAPVFYERYVVPNKRVNLIR